MTSAKLEDKSQTLGLNVIIKDEEEENGVIIKKEEGDVLNRDHSTEAASSSSTSSPSPSPVPIQANEGFTKDQTLFFIELMRRHIEAEGEGLPKTLKDLNTRLKSAKANKKQLWKDTAETLGRHFKQSFCPDKVARKWGTLVDGYKKVKDNITTTGKGAMRFQFYTEMDDLLGGQHDVVFPRGALEARRPVTLGLGSSVTALADTAFSSSTSPMPPPTPARKRKRVDEVMRFLQAAEEASQRRHEETLTQLRSAQQGFESLMSRLLDKL
ncbi:uncharacterized protein LOC105027433 [Esox lucius]|uniref:uncharacterized protein LOC105027433 n=1 Tax=Esox lucius TaxID=8010 RepID=UPI000577CEC8|nr:uncharacterized protein LOC105027433 [Esox lucius]XP_028971857.1 uncharacterized protein LOC105027433 [Esox lucius]XP_028971858.1 uncharacterized protein LOC105027433 [Esox lucius]